MTNLNATCTTPSSRQRGDEAQLFADLNQTLFHSVRHAINASDALIEDACSFAWFQLLRYQPDRETVFGWLRTTAIRQAWSLSAVQRRAISIDETLETDGTGYTAANRVAAIDLDLQVDAREALASVAGLRPLHRRTFSRHLAGLTYAEIAEENGQTLRQIDRHLRKARVALNATRGANTPAAA